MLKSLKQLISLKLDTSTWEVTNLLIINEWELVDKYES